MHKSDNQLPRFHGFINHSGVGEEYLELLIVDNRSEPCELSLGQIGPSIGEKLNRVFGDLNPEEEGMGE